MGGGVVNFVGFFFRGGRMLREIKHTNIFFIPKVESPFRVNQFRTSDRLAYVTLITRLS